MKSMIHFTIRGYMATGIKEDFVRPLYLYTIAINDEVISFFNVFFSLHLHILWQKTA